VADYKFVADYKISEEKIKIAIGFISNKKIFK
jgi:hypothetical protein